MLENEELHFAKGKKEEREAAHLFTLVLIAETGIARHLRKDPNNNTIRKLKLKNTNPSSYEVSLFRHQFSCLRFGSLGPCVFQCTLITFSLKVCLFFASFLGLWLFAGSASIYVFLDVCVFFFYQFFHPFGIPFILDWSTCSFLYDNENWVVYSFFFLKKKIGY